MKIMTKGRFKVGRFEVHPLQPLSILLILCIWQVVAVILRAVTPSATEILPTIDYVFSRALPEFAIFGGGQPSFLGGLEVIGHHSLITIYRLLVGTVVGVVAGVGLGLAIGWSSKLRSLLELPIEVVRMVPALALIPLFLLWFGGREVGNIIYVAFCIFIILVINTVEAIRNVPPAQIQFAMTLGATRSQIYRTIIMPAIVPSLIGAMRVALGTSWAIVLAAEYLAAQDGLGKLLIFSTLFFYTGRMIVIVLLFMLYSVVLNLFFLFVARRVTRWMPR